MFLWPTRTHDNTTHNIPPLILLQTPILHSNAQTIACRGVSSTTSRQTPHDPPSRTGWQGRTGTSHTKRVEIRSYCAACPNLLTLYSLPMLHPKQNPPYPFSMVPSRYRYSTELFTPGKSSTTLYPSRPSEHLHSTPPTPPPPRRAFPQGRAGEVLHLS